LENIAEIKSRLQYYIASTDDIQVLSKVKEFISTLLSEQNKIVAYDARGRGLNLIEYKKDLDEAIEQANSGEVIPVDDIQY